MLLYMLKIEGYASWEQREDITDMVSCHCVGCGWAAYLTCCQQIVQLCKVGVNTMEVRIQIEPRCLRGRMGLRKPPETHGFLRTFLVQYAWKVCSAPWIHGVPGPMLGIGIHVP